MDVISIILSLVLLMTFAYRGFSVIVVAPIFALESSFAKSSGKR